MTSGQKIESRECPLCMENLEIDDFNFFPCTCKYQVCRFCWNRIITSENGLCPACRRPYNSEEPASFKPMTNDEIKQLKRKQKSKLPQGDDSRKELSDKRVVQPNLLFVANIPPTFPMDEEVLRTEEFFGKYGHVLKVVLTQSSSSSAPASAPTVNGIGATFISAYVTFREKKDAFLSLLDMNRQGIHGQRSMKVSLGTTKYCAQFLKGLPCTKKECMYLHQRAEDRASFTKEEMNAGKHTQYEQELLENFLSDPSGQLSIARVMSRSWECNDRLELPQALPIIPCSTASQTKVIPTTHRSHNPSASGKNVRDHMSSSSHVNHQGKKQPNSKSTSSSSTVPRPTTTHNGVPHLLASNMPAVSQLTVHSSNTAASSLSSRSRQNSEPSPITSFPESSDSVPSLMGYKQQSSTAVTNVGCTEITPITQSTASSSSSCSNFMLPAPHQHHHPPPPHHHGPELMLHQYNNNNTCLIAEPLVESAPSYGLSMRTQRNNSDEDHSWLLEIVTDNLTTLHQMASEEKQHQWQEQQHHHPQHCHSLNSLSVLQQQSASSLLFAADNNVTSIPYSRPSLVSPSSSCQNIPAPVPPSQPPFFGPPPGFEDVDSRHGVDLACFSTYLPCDNGFSTHTLSGSMQPPPPPALSSLSSSSAPDFSASQMRLHVNAFNEESMVASQFPHRPPSFQQYPASAAQIMSDGTHRGNNTTQQMSNASSVSIPPHVLNWGSAYQPVTEHTSSTGFHGFSENNNSLTENYFPTFDLSQASSGTLPANQKDLSEMLKTILPMDATIRFGSDPLPPQRQQQQQQQQPHQPQISAISSSSSSLAPGTPRRIAVSNATANSSFPSGCPAPSNDSPWSMDDPAIIMSSSVVPSFSPDSPRASTNASLPPHSSHKMNEMSISYGMPTTTIQNAHWSCDYMSMETSSSSSMCVDSVWGNEHQHQQHQHQHHHNVHNIASHGNNTYQHHFNINSSESQSAMEHGRYSSRLYTTNNGNTNY